jgi:uroporphyrinogen decarboxylase
MNKNKDVQNFLKVINYESPEWLPVQISLPYVTWQKNGEDLEKLVLEHPILFPEFKKGDYKNINLPLGYREGSYVDNYGTTWNNVETGLDGFPNEELAPLQNWNDWDTYEFPDPLKHYRYRDEIDWDKRKAQLDKAKANGKMAPGKIWHGAMYMRIYYLRGFENFMFDIAMQEPRLDELIDKILDFNLRLIQKWIDIGVDYFMLADDLGFQHGLPMSPEHWRKYIKPCFSKMYGLCRENDVYVGMHTDGYILDIIPDLIECGVNILNPQIRPNTLEGLKKECKGKVALKLDIDRQLLPFATPQQVRDHVIECRDVLDDPKGGLSFFAEASRDVPFENIVALFEVLEEIGCKGFSVT